MTATGRSVSARRARTGRDSLPTVRASVAGRLGTGPASMLPACERALQRAGALAGLDARHEIGLVLCDGPAIRALNRRWRGKDKSTDVLSFPLHEPRPGDPMPPGAIGDVIVALPVARRDAREAGLEFDRHVDHLLVHGLLHLLGHDHMKDDEADRMEAEERRILNAMQTSEPC